MPIDSIELSDRTIEIPARTAWPIVLAAGLTLILAGLVTGLSISLLGAIIACAGAYGWFRNVLPVEDHESVQVDQESPLAVTTRREVARVTFTQAPHRALLPIEIYPVSAGIKGGLAGGAAMACLAVLYGIASGHGIWYPINLLAAGFMPESTGTQHLEAFHSSVFVIAFTIHLLASLLVGLLYGAVLPSASEKADCVGRHHRAHVLVWAPLFHSRYRQSDAESANRLVLVVLSQIGFGIVAGIVVARQERVAITQRLPFELRMGLEKTGLEERQ